MSIARIYNTKEAILIKDLMVTYNNMVFESDSFKDKFITFEEYLLYTLKLLNDRKVSKERQFNILYEYEFLMNFPSYMLDNIYEKQVDFDYFSVVMGDKREEELCALKKKENAVQVDDYIGSSSDELIKRIYAIEKSFSKDKNVKILFEKIRYNRLQKDVRFYDLYFKNLNFEQKNQLDELWIEEYHNHFMSDLHFAQPKWLNADVLKRLIHAIERGKLSVLELNYDLYDDTKSLSTFMENSKQKLDCDSQSHVATKQLIKILGEKNS